MRDEYRDHYDRPSWAEIDKRKDRSRHTDYDDDRPRKSKRQRDLDKRATKAKKEMLDKLFEGPKAKERKALMTKIEEARGTRGFGRLLEAYRQSFGLPKDWEGLILLLDSNDPVIQDEVIQALRPLRAEQSTDRQNIFRSRLKIIEMTGRDPEVQELAAEVLAEF